MSSLPPIKFSDGRNQFGMLQRQNAFRSTNAASGKGGAWDMMGHNLDWKDTEVFESNKKKLSGFMDFRKTKSENRGFWRRKREAATPPTSEEHLSTLDYNFSSNSTTSIGREIGKTDQEIRAMNNEIWAMNNNAQWGRNQFAERRNGGNSKNSPMREAGRMSSPFRSGRDRDQEIWEMNNAHKEKRQYAQRRSSSNMITQHVVPRQDSRQDSRPSEISASMQDRESNNSSTSGRSKGGSDSLHWSQHSLSTLGLELEQLDVYSGSNHSQRKTNIHDYEGSRRQTERMPPLSVSPDIMIDGEIQNVKDVNLGYFSGRQLRKGKSDRFEFQRPRPLAQSIFEKSKSENAINSSRRRHSIGTASVTESLESKPPSRRRHSIGSVAESFDSSNHHPRRNLEKSKSAKTNLRSTLPRESMLRKSKSDSIIPSSTSQNRSRSHRLSSECSLYDLGSRSSANLSVDRSNYRLHSSEPHRRRNSSSRNAPTGQNSEPRPRRSSSRSGVVDNEEWKSRDEKRRKKKSMRRSPLSRGRSEKSSRSDTSMRRSKSMAHLDNSLPRRIRCEENGNQSVEMRRSRSSASLQVGEKRHRSKKRIPRRENESHRSLVSSDSHRSLDYHRLGEKREDGRRRRSEQDECSLYDVKDTTRKSSRSVSSSSFLLEAVRSQRGGANYAVDPNERISETCRMLKEARLRRRAQKHRIAPHLGLPASNPPRIDS